MSCSNKSDRAKYNTAVAAYHPCCGACPVGLSPAALGRGQALAPGTAPLHFRESKPTQHSPTGRPQEYDTMCFARAALLGSGHLFLGNAGIQEVSCWCIFYTDQGSEVERLHVMQTLGAQGSLAQQKLV